MLDYLVAMVGKSDEGSRSLKLKVVRDSDSFLSGTCHLLLYRNGRRAPQVGKVSGPSSYILQSVIAVVITLCTAAAASAASCNDLR